MALPRSYALAALTLLLLLTATVVTPAAGAPPPEAVCGLCTDDALDGGVERSEVVIRIRDDGRADWTVRAALDERTATELRADADDRRDRVRSELTWRTVVDEVSNLDTRVENRTLVVTFTTDDFAHRGVGGVFVVDGLFPSHEKAGVSVHADRLAVVGPSGAAPTLVPDSADAVDGAVVWTDGGDLGPRTYVGFAGDGGVVATGVTVVAVGAERVGALLPAIASAAFLPTLLFAGGLAGLLRYGDRLRPAEQGLATRVALVGVAVAPVLLAVGVGAFLLGTNGSTALGDHLVFGGLALVSLVPGTLVAAGVAAVLALWGARLRLDRYARWTFPAAAVCWLVLVGSTGPNRLLGTWTTTALLFLPLGAAHERGGLATLPVAVVVLVAPALASMPLVASSFAPGWVLLVWAVGTLPPGVALYVLGRQESAAERLEDGTDGADADELSGETL